MSIDGQTERARLVADVKGSHILLTDNFIIKLIDFGVAALFTREQSKRNSSVGTALWMAPVGDERRCSRVSPTGFPLLGSDCLCASS